jgi:hypothetical protein
MQHATRIATPCNMQCGSLHHAACNADRCTIMQRATHDCAKSPCRAVSVQATNWAKFSATAALGMYSPQSPSPSQSRCRCGSPEPQSRCRCGSPGADVGCTLQDLQGPREGVAQCAVGVLATGAVPRPHPHRHWARRCHICTSSGFPRGHICTGTGLTAATTALGLGSPLPHLHCDWAHSCHICNAAGLAPCHICTETGRDRGVVQSIDESARHGPFHPFRAAARCRARTARAARSSASA